MSEVAGMLDPSSAVSESSTVARQAHFDVVSLKTSNVVGPSTQHVTIRASLANHLLAAQHSLPSTAHFAVTTRANESSIIGGNPMVSSATTSVVGQTVRLTTGLAGHAFMSPSADGANQSHLLQQQPQVCVLAPGSIVRGPLGSARIPILSSDLRFTTPVVQTMSLQATRAEIPRTVITAVSPLIRSSAIMQAASAGAGPIVAGIPTTAVRAILPMSIPGPRLPGSIVRTPVTVNVQQLPHSWPTMAATTTATTIQIAIRAPVDSSASSVIRPVTSVSHPNLAQHLLLQQQPRPTVVAAPVAHSAVGLLPRNVENVVVARSLSRPRAPSIVQSTTAVAPVSAPLGQLQAINLTSKPKITLVAPGPMPTHRPSATVSPHGQTVALNLSQSAQQSSHSTAVNPVPSSLAIGGQILGQQSALASRPGVMSATSIVQSPAVNIVTISKLPQHQLPRVPSLLTPTRPRMAPVTTQTAMLPQQVHLQVSQPSVPTVLMSGSSGAGTTMHVSQASSHLNGRLPQHMDRTMHPAVRPEFAGQLFAVQNSFQPAMLNSTTWSSLASQPLPAVSSANMASLPTGPRMGQVVVSMDGMRRTVALQPQPHYIVDLSATAHYGSVTETTASPTHQTMMSPKPSILRKRPYDSVTPKKTNLLSSFNAASSDGSSGVGETTVPAACRAGPVLNATTVPSSPFRSIEPEMGSNTSAEVIPSLVSTSGPCLPTTEKCSQDSTYQVNNGNVQNGHGEVPRKKPRKQSLHANEEMPAAGFSSADEAEDRAEMERMQARLRLRQHLEREAEEAFEQNRNQLGESLENEIRFTVDRSPRRFPGGIVGTQNNSSMKTRNNHYLSYNDIIVKEERRQTVTEIANSKRAAHRASGWAVHYFTDHMTQLSTMECDIMERLQAIKPLEKARLDVTTDSINAVNELVLGNIQRCRQYIERLDEAKSMLLNITTAHRHRVHEIISKHQSKRNVKKKERL